MAKLINIGFGNVVNSQKIVAVVNPDAAPVKRMVQSVKGTNSLVDATQGRKTKSVIVTSDDILILSAIIAINSLFVGLPFVADTVYPNIFSTSSAFPLLHATSIA